MKLRCLPHATALALAIPAFAAIAETRAPTPAAVASAPTATRPGPRLVSPTELNENASPLGQLRPENPVTPQIVIPLRNSKAPLTKAEKPALRPYKPAVSGGVDDSAARCEALSDAAARTACRDKLKH